MDADRVLELANVVQSKQGWFAFFVKRTLAAHGLKASKEDIEDILSESFLMASTKLMHNESLNIANYHAWFTKIVYYTSLNARKKRLIKNSKMTEKDISEFNDYYYVHDFINESSNIKLVRGLLRHLDETEQRIIQMSVVEGYTSREIAEKLQIKEPATVRKMKSRAIEKLKRKIN